MFLPTPHSLLRRRHLVSAVALLAAAVPSAADAGTYTVQSCQTTAGVATSTSGWAAGASPNIVGGQDASISCGGATGGLNLATNTTQNQQANSYRWWEFSAPADTRIVGARIRYSINFTQTVAGDTGGSTQSAWMWHDGWGWAPGTTTDRVCISSQGCWSDQGTHTFTGDAQSIGMTAGCGANTSGAVCGAGQRQNNSIRYASIDLDDSSSPLVASTGGTALDPRSLVGTETLTVGATDQGGGLYRIEAKLGTTMVVTPQAFDTNNGRCQYVEGGSFGWPVPCKLSGSATIPINTSLVPDGSYPLEVSIYDAAGNKTVAVSRRVTIDNVPPPVNRVVPTATGTYTAGSLLTADKGTWDGTAISYGYQWQRSTDGVTWGPIPGATAATYRLDDADVGAYVRVAVTATNVEGATTVAALTPATKTRQRESSLGGVPAPTNPNGTGGDVTSGRVLMTNTSSRGVVTRYGRVIAIKGRILDAAGQPIAGAKVDVFERVALPNAAKVKVATIMTGADGTYTYRPATFSSRSLEFAYAASVGSSSYRDSQSISLQVKSSVHFKASKRRASSGAVVKFAGRVMAKPLPKRGVRVVIEAQAGSRWVTAAVIRTKASGKFSWSHRFSNRGSYRLRARVLGSSDLPAQPSSSRFVGLRVQ